MDEQSGGELQRGGGANLLERAKAIATIFSLVAVPVIVAILGLSIQRSGQETDARTKITELAIQILKEPPNRNGQPGLRTWAIDMLERSSNSSLSDAARRELQSKPLLSTQPVQKNVTSATISWLTVGKQEETFGRKLFLQNIDGDIATILADGIPKMVAMNDSVVLLNNCVLNLLGFAHDGEDAAKPVDTAVVAYVCPK